MADGRISRWPERDARLLPSTIPCLSLRFLCVSAPLRSREMEMKVAIVGCGAMGSMYAALLADAGHDVWAIDNWKEHVEAIRKDGLRLEGASGDRTVRVSATSDPRAAGPCDLAILATKAMHVEAAAKSMQPLLKSDTVVLSIQNGLGGPDT